MLQTGKRGINETLSFVLKHIPSRPCRILEVGRVHGELAKRLQDIGHEIIAIDSSEANIENAKKLGVDARRAAEPVDVLQFTRSPHHIQPLQPAINRARELIKPSGLLVIEDFAFSDISEYTARWFYRLLKLLEACNVLEPAEDSFGRKLLNCGRDFSLCKDHVHEINCAQEILAAISEEFQVLEVV